jgi:hypothetical protein
MNVGLVFLDENGGLDSRDAEQIHQRTAAAGDL